MAITAALGAAHGNTRCTGGRISHCGSLGPRDIADGRRKDGEVLDADHIVEATLSSMPQVQIRVSASGGAGRWVAA